MDMLFANKVVNLVYLVLWLHNISTGLFFPLKPQVQITIYSTGIKIQLAEATAVVEEERKHRERNVRRKSNESEE